MKEKIPEELRKEFEQAVLNADLDHWMVDNDRQFLDKIWDAVDKLFNQEVEKRIKERMPTEEEIIPTAYEYFNSETGHCYVDYIPQPEMNEADGYTKIPLYNTHQAQHLFAKSEIKMPTIDKNSWFYKNCKRQRKVGAKICQCCPFRDGIESMELSGFATK